MSKEYKDIDDLFRTELGGATTPAPAFVKPNIDKALGFSKRRAGFLWFGMLTALVIGITAGIYLLVPDDAANQLASTGQNQSTEMALNAQENKTTAIESTSNSRSNASTSIQTEVHDQAAQRSTNTQTQTQTYSTPSGAGSGRIKTRTQPTIDSITTGMASTGPLFASGSTFLKDDPLKLDHKQSVKTTDEAAPQTSERNPDELVLSSGDNTELSNSTDSTVTDEQEIPTKIDQTDENLDKPIEDPYANISPIDTTPLRKVPSWMVSLTGGPNFVRSSYTAINANDKTIFDNGTQDLIGSQFNADLVYRFKKGLSIGSGLGITNLSEKFAFETKSIELDSVQNVEYVYDTLDVVIDSIITWTTEEVTKINPHEGTSKANFVTIPIHLGAQLVWGKVELDIFSTIRFNFLTRSSGGYIQDHVFYNFESGTSIYKPFYVDLLFGARLHYRFWKTLYATANVQYRPVLGQSYTTTSFNKSFDYVHLGVGISYRF